MNTRTEMTDYAALSERMSNLLLLRLALAAVVLISAAMRPEALGVAFPVLAGVTVGYLFAAITFEAVRRRTGRAGFTILNSLLLLDGLYLAFAMYATGGTHSPMRFLIYLHLVAVSLLASYRTGLKIALWDSLLLFVMLYAQAAGLVPPVDTAAGAAIVFDSMPVLNVTAFWLFALATSIFSAMNERELRNRRADLEALVDLGTGLDAVGDPVHQARIVLDGLADRFETKRGVVLGASDDRIVILAGKGVADVQSAPTAVDAVVQKAWDRHDVLPIRRIDVDKNPLLAAALPNARNLLIAPMIAEGLPVGAIVIEHRSRSVFGVERRVMSVLAQFASVAALNFRNAVLLRHVQDLAERDSLTGAANRRTFQHALERIIAAPRRGSAKTTGVLFLDVDDFKVVNDTLGHAAGDALLVAVTERISALVRQGDLVARLGGDEFAILTSDDNDLHRSRAMAERLVRELRTPYLIRDEQVAVTASIGIASAHGHDQSAEEVLRNADVAMYMAKANGKARFAIFDPGMHAAIRERHELGAQLQRAVELEQLRLVYQPIVELGTGRVAGLEALVRWQHPERGLIAPGEFIEIAEENGAILPIGSWVLREACQHAGNWQREGLTPKGIFLCVNVSAREVQQPDFVASVRETLTEAGLEPSSLMMEITETALLKATGPTMSTLTELRELGVQVVIDDFGTGYFSLSHLRQFPVDALKIASEFVQVSNTDARSAALAGAIVALSQSLGITTVAEGIETGEQAKRMESLGCAYGQGFFFASPMEQAEIDKGVAGLANAVRRQRRRRTDTAPAADTGTTTTTTTPTPAARGTRAPRIRTRTPRLIPADPTAA
ncbi:MAG TPA: EAL domain-containing protein [Candidatus Limnocylindria bacterium]|nr:EAL domain-containing protein [Candidatus Limnocylindria bacterium]